MPGTGLISAFFHGLVQREWQSPAGFTLAAHPPPSRPLTVHCWQAISISTDSGTIWTMPVALCTDVDVWRMVALVLRASDFIQCQCPDVSWNAHSLPPEIDAVWCPEHLKLSLRRAVKCWAAEEGRGAWRIIQGEGTRCRTMTSKLCHELPATRALHGLITTWSATEGPFHFLPLTLFHSLLWRGEGRYPTQPRLTMEHKVLAEGTSQCALGLFLITVSGCDSECALADDGLPPFPSRPPSSPGDEQAACPLCVSLAGFSNCCSSLICPRQPACRLDRALTVVFTIYGHQSSGAVSWPG